MRKINIQIEDVDGKRYDKLKRHDSLNTHHRVYLTGLAEREKLSVRVKSKNG